MTWTKGQSGNPAGRAKDKVWADTIRIAVNEAFEGGDRKKLRALADKLVEKALDGDLAAIKEIGDRLDGKSVQATQLTADIKPGYVALMPGASGSAEEWQKRYLPQAQ